MMYPRYLADEYKDKKGGTLNLDDWKLVPTQPDTPQQENSCDCGVFATCFAYLLSEKLPVSKVRSIQSPLQVYASANVCHCVCWI